MRAVIVNPASASGRTADRWRRIVTALNGDGHAREVELTTGPGSGLVLARRLIEDGVREIAILGGDGTVGEVIAGCMLPDGSGMRRDDLILSVIHQGTGGDFVRGMELPRDEAGAIRIARDGQPRRIDVGVARYTPASEDPSVAMIGEPDAEGRHLRGFISTANIGMSTDVIRKVEGPFKRFGNNASFGLATISCLARNRPRPVRITTADGGEQTPDIVDVVVCNNRFMGGGMMIAPDARLDDGLLDLVVINAASRTRLIRTFPKIYSGGHIGDSLVQLQRTTQVQIAAGAGAEEQGVALDGELVGTTPASFTLLPSAISIRC